MAPQPTPRLFCFGLGYSADHFAARAIEAGAIEFLTKPLDLDELARRLVAIRTGDG